MAKNIIFEDDRFCVYEMVQKNQLCVFVFHKDFGKVCIESDSFAKQHGFSSFEALLQNDKVKRYVEYFKAVTGQEMVFSVELPSTVLNVIIDKKVFVDYLRSKHFRNHGKKENYK